MEPGLFIEVLKLIASPLKKSWQFCRLRAYRIASKRPPLTEQEARQIAYAVLARRIEDAIPYRNLGSKKIQIAVSYHQNGGRFATNVAILEQVGKSYRVIWEMGCPSFLERIEKEDIDNDGFQEIIINIFGCGTGAHTKCLMVFFQKRNAVYTIDEHTERQNLAGPLIPEIRFDPEPPAELRRALEESAIKRGFFNADLKIDWDDKKHAIKRWHRDNGPDPDGKIAVVFYDGCPPAPGHEVSAKDFPFASTIVDFLDDGEIVWTSFYKNPLVGHVIEGNKWFIAYSPSNFYSWACSLAHDGKRLWFGVHAEAIYSFEFSTMQLHKHSSIQGVVFKSGSKVLFKDGRLYVNDEVSFSRDELEKAVQLKEFHEQRRIRS